jgi:hypothetical protein
MAVTYRGVSNAAGQNNGATGTGTADITPTLPGSTASGDRVFVVQCGSNTSGTTPTGWTVIGSKDTVVGSGAVSSGAGLRYQTIYYRDYDGVWSMPTFSLTSATNNSHWCGAVSVSKTTGQTWDTPTISTVGGAFNTATTAYTDTTAASFTTHAGGFLLIGTAVNDNVTSTGGTLTQTGATFGTTTERCDGGTATGNVVAGKLHTSSVTTGASATATFTLTLSAASQGETRIVEQTASWAKMETLTETFAAGLPGTWGVDPPGSTTSASGGGIRIDHDTSTTYNITYYNGDFLDLTGSYAMIEVTDYGVSAAGHDRSLELQISAGNVLGLGAAVGNLYAYRYVGASYAQIGSTITLDATAHRWLRIRESAGTIYFDTAPDASTWTNRWTLTNPFAVTAIYPQVTTGNFSAGTTGYVVFDNLNLVPAGVKQGSASGSYAWAGSAVGDTPPNRGSTSGAYNWVGSATGDTPPNRGSAAGTYTWTGAAVGDTPANRGSATGTYTFAGTGAGKRTPKATAAGSYTWSGSAVGDTPPNRGAGTGTYTWAGTAVGDTPPNRGSATGTYAWSGSAAGDTPPNRGTASGAYAWAGIASGQTPAEDVQAGSAAGFYTFTGTATGIHPSKGAATGSYMWAGTTTGRRTPKASASGAYAWAGVAVGQTPAVGVNDGTASGSYTWAGTANGTRTSRSTISGFYGWAGSAAGRRISRGTGAGTYLFTGTASGQRPVLLIPQGSATGSYNWTGFAVSGGARIGSAAGSYGWDGQAWGWLLHFSAERMLIVLAEDRTLRVRFEDRTLHAPFEDRTLTVVADNLALTTV